MSDINPCLGPLRASEGDINKFNEYCYNMCAAFTDNGFADEAVYGPCGQKCSNCAEAMIRAKGRDPCAFWPRTPTIKLRRHFFRNVLKEVGNPERALAISKSLCRQYASECPEYDSPEECMMYCDFEYEALKPKIQSLEKYTKTTPKPRPKPENCERCSHVLVGICVAVAALLLVLLATAMVMT